METAVFRAPKRRKLLRAQSDSSPSSAEPAEPLQTSVYDGPLTGSDPSDGHNHDSGVDDHRDALGSLSKSNLLRARKGLRRPVAGVHFSTTKSERADDEMRDLEAKDTGRAEPLRDMSSRFVGSLGHVVNDDKHMVAFIESEMKRRRQNHLEGETGPPVESDVDHQSTTAAPARGTNGMRHEPANSAANRQLSEVDLGSSAHALNLARTRAALERARFGQAPLDEDAKPSRPHKVRIGRDGQPIMPRPWRRRNSEDVTRDALVEQVLHENKIDMYDVASSAAQAGSLEADDQGDADERLAEQFRQDFMEAVAERQQRAKPSAPSKGTGASGAEPKGPKLGGSRSARAKMAQMQQQQQQSQQPK